MCLGNGGVKQEMRWRGPEGEAEPSVCSVASLNDDFKNRRVNRWSGGKRGSALHQKAPSLCEQERSELALTGGWRSFR